MNEKERVKEELEDQLKKVKQQLQILDMIDERLFEMKDLAQKVIDGKLTEQKIKEVNNRVQRLEQQVVLLDKESTQLS